MSTTEKVEKSDIIYLRTFSSSVIFLLNGILNKLPYESLTVQPILSHPWMLKTNRTRESCIKYKVICLKCLWKFNSTANSFILYKVFLCKKTVNFIAYIRTKNFIFFYYFMNNHAFICPYILKPEIKIIIRIININQNIILQFYFIWCHLTCLFDFR